MSYIKAYLKRRAEGKLQRAEREKNAIRLAFTTRYLSFKTLLGLNDRVLEIINEMEQALEGSRGFGIAFIRANCTALSVNIYKIIQSLNEITEQRNEALLAVFDTIWAGIDHALKRKKNTTPGPWVLPLDAVGREMADQTGNKMAYLGEVKNRLGLAVPEGFVVTSAAYEFFLGETGLREEINRKIQLLDRDDMAQLHETSAEIQQLIVRTPLPAELESTILSAHRDLLLRVGVGVRVSLRSSAVGEDVKGASFAGQYHSILNVSGEFLIISYKEVVAGKYSVPAILYRLNMGFLDEDIPMCVGCVPMVPAVAAGVMYSADPGAGFHDAIVINAVFGLGKAVVEGSIAPDLYVLDRKDPRILIRKEIKRKEHKIVSHAQEGVLIEEVDEEKKEAPTLTDQQARELAGIAMQLEEHFATPQDIEWALDPEGMLWILQTRPLVVPDKKKAGDDILCESADYPKLLEGGITASPGKAYGPAFLVDTAVDMLRFPEGAVLVARNPLPKWAALLNKAAAIVTDQGALTGHLAAVAREFKIPALMATSTAFQRIRTGDPITVDADGQKVYAGKVEALLAGSAEKSSLIQGSPVYHVLEEVLSYIAPLNLTDPEGPDFTPQGCRTLHDIIRYAHEISLRELFDDRKQVSFPQVVARKLVSHVPMEWWVLDLEGGIREGLNGDTLSIEDVTCDGALALWAGFAAFPWKGPPPVDAAGFLSILAESTMKPELEVGREGSALGGRNYLVVSRDFFHLSTRLGFHYSTVEAFLGDRVAENYVWFYFKGGAADRQRKEQRSTLIKTILERFHFWVQINGDMVSARIERREKGYMMERLKVLGYVILHTRQLDMVLSGAGTARWYVEQMLKELSTVVDAHD
jgi:pyruvate,water dikinase